MHWRACLFGLLGACASTPSADDGRPQAEAPSAAESVRSSEAPTGAATSIAFSIDDRSSGCNADTDCQVLAACDCERCIASRRMEVEQCPRACKVDACAGHAPRCTGHLCVDGATAPTTFAPSVGDELTAAGQVLLDDPRLSQYFHEKERPERVPLVVAWPPNAPKPRWQKFGRAVTFADGLPDAQPYLLPSLLRLGGDSATFNLSYESEGIFVGAELRKKEGHWVVDRLDITERRR